MKHRAGAHRRGHPGSPTVDGRAAVELRKVMTRPQQCQYWLIVALWLAANGYFWEWWLTRQHIGNTLLFVLMTAALFYSATVLSSMYALFLGYMRRPVPIPVSRAEDSGVIGRVAVISLTVPGSESLDIVRAQLVAMTRIRYPHDSWILVDKEHSPEIAAMAQSLGVRYFCRHDEETWGKDRVSAWNQANPPFKAKTKAGNVNSWLDAYGDLYSHFTQFDIDHLADPSYLDRVLGYFVDRQVKWVQAPSVYGNHLTWTARGSSEQEFGLQGPLQMGFFGFSRTPFIIGSHCTYDMAAIRGIGGFQPTRAEDHLDTVCLAAKGYQGVFVPDVLAVGGGPETFETYLSQQFAWAYSMIEVLLFHTPRLIWRYRPRQAVQFLFVQTWYTFWSLSMVVLFCIPLLSLLLNTPVAHVGYLEFLSRSIWMAIMATVIWYWSRPWHVPAGLRLSWRGVVLHVARWVVVFSAFIQVLLRVKKPYMITRKGVDGAGRPFPMQVLTPYIAMVLIALASCWFYLGLHHRGPSQGYLFFGLQDAALFWLLLVITVVQEVRSAHRTGTALPNVVALQARPLLVSGLLGVLFLGTAVASSGPIIQALAIW
ncbi:MULTISPECIES: glycosyltransferase family 2 protein [unclassified Pseudofrankia]|uniref:glycosyltransferase family 2 protein n=1 Tax=unclassified Pseudofrankia TaxID=2994372 RepID=UPI0009120F25|nr:MULTISPECIES: glycosyltransferase family 2 protein [unclassified Pseudofrankia]MDT3439311.1 glycosyltransferase [Pseudofrankia sp. BMG5.37]OHV73933.1 cellulose synthase [Pseudofrankia sp. BMG5.36]